MIIRSRGAIDVNVVSNIVGKISQQILSATSIAKGTTKNVDISVPPGKTGIIVTLKVTYNSSATEGVKLDAFYSPDGNNYDNYTDETYSHPFSAGNTAQKTYIIPAVCPYIRLSITNLDSNYSVTVDLWATFI